MREFPKHILELQDMFDALRVTFKATDVYNKPGLGLVYGTGIAFIMSLPFILLHFFKTKQKRTRLIATSPRTTLDYLAKNTSDVFAFIILPLFAVLFVGGLKFDTELVSFGYFLHVSTGSLYMITGGLQFYAPLRQRYPKVHRYLGYTHYLMVLMTALGISFIAIRPYSGFPTQIAVLSFLPPWVIVNILAFRAIVFFREVELHRQLNILSFSYAWSVIIMRPMAVVFLLLDMEMTFVFSMGMTLWVGLLWGIIAAAVYIIYAYTLPTVRFPRLQHSGEMIANESAHCPLEGMIQGVVYITSFKSLDPRTVNLKLSTSSHTAVRHPVFPIAFPPGSHLSLKLGNVVREFSPVNSGSNPDEVEIVIRLVPGGAFSNLLSSSLGLTSQGPLKSAWSECFLECGIYGPIRPLPSKFGYRPYFSTGKSLEVDPLRPTLIMIGAGSGSMPFFSVIEAALKNKKDETQLKLLALSGGSKGSDSEKACDLGAFVDGKINQLHLLTKSVTETKTDLGAGRFIGVNSRERFSLSMLDSWIQIPSEPTRTNTSAVLTAATERMIVWICGPPGFGEECRSALVKGKGFSKDQIFVLGIDDR